jgi:hypothetical protein
VENKEKGNKERRIELNKTTHKIHSLNINKRWWERKEINRKYNKTVRRKKQTNIKS